MSGIAFGLSQITLVFFTTLMPTGALAFTIAALYLMCAHLEDAEKTRLEKFLVLPIAIALVGLIASTSHLGKPSNSLFVLTGTGRSPLSNEVMASIIFMGLAWIRWLVAFGSKPRVGLKNTLTIAASIAAVAQIFFTSNAYAIPTISTWSLPYTQVNQVLEAIMGGALLAETTFCAAHTPIKRAFSGGLLGTSAAATVACIVFQTLQCIDFANASSTTADATLLEPFYASFIGLFAVLAIAALIVAFVPFFRKQPHRLASISIASALMLIGIFAMRFAFYCTYVNVGMW